MRKGEFDDGSQVLRAKIDMGSPNLNMRDPVIYRIRRITHHQTGTQWIIYPMYDFTHCLSDSIEGITHSLCTLEYEDHRPLYDWVLNEVGRECHPQQIEFSRLNLEYTITSKRKLNQLVTESHVNGWDDPRMTTISGLRRRGYTPESIINFCQQIGVSKNINTTEIFLLENSIRQDLEQKARRVLGVLRPLKIIIENYPSDQIEELQAKYHPQNEEWGTRILPFSKEIYIDENDFSEEPPPKYKRLIPGGEIRLRYAYVIRCERVIKDEKTGRVIELRCSYDTDTLGKKPEGRKVKGVVHWVAAQHSVPAEVTLYDRLFTKALPEEDKDVDFKTHINPNSKMILSNARVEQSLLQTKPGTRYQFEREGYFIVESVNAEQRHLAFNRIVTLRDTWANIEKQTS